MVVFMSFKRWFLVFGRASRWAVVGQLLGTVMSQAATTQDHHWTNSLGQEFVPVPKTKVLFCKWETRVQDFEAFVKVTAHDTGNEMFCFDEKQNWGSHTGYNWRKPGFDFQQGPTHPVVGVNWDDAQTFCQWLTSKEKAAGLLREGQAYRLPTDEEWSIAAGLPEEGGSSPEEKDGKIKDVYPWGTSWPPPAGTGNFADITKKKKYSRGSIIEGYDDGYAETSPVGSFKANAYGLYDLSGNVSEWCEDRAEVQNCRVLRGASWIDRLPEHFLSSFRMVTPVNRFNHVGFRVVLAGPALR
jgi:formylglycine-generating enzyme required for sulfatase activity